MKPVAPVMNTVLGNDEVIQDAFEGEEARGLTSVEIGKELEVVGIGFNRERLQTSSYHFYVFIKTICRNFDSYLHRIPKQKAFNCLINDNKKLVRGQVASQTDSMLVNNNLKGVKIQWLLFVIINDTNCFAFIGSYMDKCLSHFINSGYVFDGLVLFSQ